MPTVKSAPTNDLPAATAAWRDQRWRFHLAVALAAVGVPLAEIGITVSFIGAHRTPDVRAADHWTLWLTIAILATGTVLGATALGSGLPKHPVRQAREIRLEAAYGPRRAAYFGPKAPWAVAVVPALVTIPALIAESVLLPQDPATGQAGVDVGAAAAGTTLAMTAVLLREVTGRSLTLLCVAVWCAWAWFAQDAQEPTAGWVGGAGIAAVFLALAATVLERRFFKLHG
jgi:hypothetical protein